MAKAKIKNKQLPTAAPEKAEITGDHIPTPQDLPQRKPSLVASKLAGWCRHSLDNPLRRTSRPNPSPLKSVTLPFPALTVLHVPLPPNPTQQTGELVPPFPVYVRFPPNLALLWLPLIPVFVHASRGGQINFKIIDYNDQELILASVDTHKASLFLYLVPICISSE